MSYQTLGGADASSPDEQQTSVQDGAGLGNSDPPPLQIQEENSNETPQTQKSSASRVIQVLPTPSKYQSNVNPSQNALLQSMDGSPYSGNDNNIHTSNNENSGLIAASAESQSDFSLLSQNGVDSPMSQSVAYSMFIPRNTVPNDSDMSYNEYVEQNVSHNAALMRTATPHHGEAHIQDKKQRKESLTGLTGESSIPAVLGNMLNAIVGAGIVGLPYVFDQSGVIGGTLLIVLFAMISGYSLNLMIQCAKWKKIQNYEDLCEYCFGNLGYYAVSMAMLVFDLGAMLSYLIILGDASIKVLEVFGSPFTDDKLFWRRIIIASINIVIILPACLFRDISSIEKLSGFSVFVKCLIVIIVIYKFIFLRLLDHTQDNDSNYHTSLPSHISFNENVFDVTGLPSSLGIVAFASVCHDSAFLVYNTLYKPTLRRWNILIFSALSSSSFIALIFSFAGYFTFGEMIDQNILNNYSTHDPYMVFTRSIYAISMSLSYPTAFFVVRHVLYALFHRGPNYVSIQNASLKKHLLFTLPLWLILLVLALLIKSLGIVMSVSGSLAAVTLAFILPSACFLKMSEYHIDFWNYPDQSACKTIKTLYPSLLLLIVGIILAIFCPVYSIWQATTDGSTSAPTAQPTAMP